MKRTSVIPAFAALLIANACGGGGGGAEPTPPPPANQAPVVSLAEFDRYPIIGDTLVLDASASTDPNGDTLTFEWELTAWPDGSELATNYTGPIQNLVLDVPGKFDIKLRVSDGSSTTTVFVQRIKAEAYRAFLLESMIEDAEYDDIGKRIIAVGGSTLTIIGIDGTESSVDLPTEAAAVSITPDGKHAAVAHDGWVTHVDLDAETVLATHPVPATLGDVVVDADGYAHGMPQTGNTVSIQSVNLATGVVQASRNVISDAPTARLHPDGDRIYAADVGLSPSDMERYSLSNGEVTNIYDSPYHGDYPFCGDLWFGPGGDSILSRCGVIVRTAVSPTNDMTYVMRLRENPDRQYRYASSSAYTNQWLTIYDITSPSDEIKLYDVDNGAEAGVLQLPPRDRDTGAIWAASFVFGSNTSKVHYVLAVDDLEIPTMWALMAHPDLSAVAGNLPPTANVARYATVRVNETVVLDGSGSSDPEGQPLNFVWTLVSQPDGSNESLGSAVTNTLQFEPGVAGTYELELTVNDGVRTSAPARVSINVFDAGESIVHRLTNAVADIEYSDVLNTLVYIGDSDGALHLLDLSDFSERTIALPAIGYTVGISPDGLFAAVSHDQLVSLIDIVAGTLVDTQESPVGWGDIVLDHNNIAHVIPYDGASVPLYSMNFAADITDSMTDFLHVHGHTQLRMHPVENWIYGAGRRNHPVAYKKFDVSTFPGVDLGDSPFRGSNQPYGGVWISEGGDRLLTAAGVALNASSDAAVDRTFAGELPNSVKAFWVNHSAITNEWVVLAWCNPQQCAPYENKLVLYDDASLDEVEVRDLADIPATEQSYATTSRHVFQSGDGMKIILVLNSEGVLDAAAVEVSDR